MPSTGRGSGFWRLFRRSKFAAVPIAHGDWVDKNSEGGMIGFGGRGEGRVRGEVRPVGSMSAAVPI